MVKRKNRVNGLALSAYVNSRDRMNLSNGVSIYELACLALEDDDMPCPANISFKSWVMSNSDHIHQEAQRINPTKFKHLLSTGVVYESVEKRTRKKYLPVNKKKVVVKCGGVNVESDAFLNTYEWRKLRMEALKKYGPKCMCCGATPLDGAVMNVDHIKPRKLWPSLALEITNLQILCHECNHGKGNWDQTDWRR